MYSQASSLVLSKTPQEPRVTKLLDFSREIGFCDLEERIREKMEEPIFGV